MNSRLILQKPNVSSHGIIFVLIQKAM